MDTSLLGHNVVFAFFYVAALINYIATSAVGFLTSLYLQYINGFNAGYAGLILVSQPVAQAVVLPLAGRLSDRVEPRIVSSVGMTLTVIGLSLFTFLDTMAMSGFIIVSLILQGIGFGFFSIADTSAIMGSAEKKFYRVAASMTATMRLIGQMLSLGIAVSMFAIIIGRVEITPSYYPLFLVSVRFAFVVFAALCFLGIFASLARGKVRGKRVDAEAPQPNSLKK